MKPSLVIIGLGNHGKSYDRTRHNAGFAALDVLSEAFGEGEWKEKQKFASIAQEGRIITVPILLVKPHTYMNLSGEAVKKIVDFYKLNAAQQILIVSDDIDISLGTVRLRQSGGPGTHNGLKSVVEHLGENFPRLRVGIGPKPAEGDLAAWVLSRFSDEEQKTLDEVLKTLPETVKKFVMEQPE
jgi:PTH1 family peptidyl-tRNA hydrolase